MKIYYLILPLFIFSFAFSNCIDDPGIAGLYRTVVYVQPGPTDLPLNLYERGGYMEINFLKDYTLTGKWFTPSLPELNLEQSEITFGGIYSVNGDTVRFAGTNTYLDNELFFYRDGRLELEERMRRGPLEIILEKVGE
jgi:hypothetical protein